LLNNSTSIPFQHPISSPHDFDTALSLPQGLGQVVLLEAWDQAGNRSSQKLLFDVELAAEIKIIGPVTAPRSSAMPPAPPLLSC